jgi:caffeoyl-CoA O-methyltransferase
MDFLPKEIEDYSERFTTPENEVLHELTRHTFTKVLQPRMLAGHLQGRFIYMLSHMIKPKTVLEIGTYTGYSALCWAEGLVEGGTVHTLEKNDELETTINAFHEKAKKSDVIKLHIGDALESIANLEAEFEVVFIDADKENYINYYKAVFDRVPSGGYIIADNVLWSGKVTKPEDEMDLDTKVLFDYAKMIQEDDRVENILLPLRDGLLIARKK